MIGSMLIDFNQAIGSHLLTFFEGTHPINFIETVNETRQFSSIAKTFDCHFIKEVERMRQIPRIILTLMPFERNFCEDELHGEQFLNVLRCYPCFIESLERLYAHPCFSTQEFFNLCSFYKTSLFKCYSRLLSYNNVRYNSKFIPFNYELYVRSVGSRRILNEHERRLFHGKY